MSKSTDLVVQEQTSQRPKIKGILGVAKKAGIVAIAAGLAGGIALPAVAFNDTANDNEGLTSLYANEGQGGAEVHGETVVLSDEAIVATSVEEYEAYLDEIRAEEEAAAEEERQAQEAAEAESNESASPSSSSSPTPTSSSTGGNQTVVDAALAQIGVNQDCFALMRNAVAAAGYSINSYAQVHALQQVPMSEAKPGDILFYHNGGLGQNHVAIYIGNGQAVHGGWNGNQTVVGSANVGSGPIAYRLP